jgi:hypothetical protein
MCIVDAQDLRFGPHLIEDAPRGLFRSPGGCAHVAQWRELLLIRCINDLDLANEIVALTPQPFLVVVKPTYHDSLGNPNL